MDPDDLKKIDVFTELSDEQRDKLARRGTEASGDEGAVILEEGAGSDQMLAIIKGEVEVRDGDERLATLKAGDVVGETGVVERALRNASVVAKSDVHVLIVAQSDIKELRRENSKFDEKLQSLVEERSDD